MQAAPPRRQLQPRRLVLLGAPGIGKGTQAELLCKGLGTCHLSTRDVFRGAKSLDPCERSPALDAALQYMRRGDLVPDGTVLDMVKERLRCLTCQGGFLLDGFPRTVVQAEALSQMLQEQHVFLEAVLSYDLPLEQVVARLSGRRTCGKCKAVFHVTGRPPKKAGICDHCGGRLFSATTTGRRRFGCGCRLTKRAPRRSSTITSAWDRSSRFQRTAHPSRSTSARSTLSTLERWPADKRPRHKQKLRGRFSNESAARLAGLSPHRCEKPQLARSPAGS